MLLIHVREITPRVEYIFKFIFDEILKVRYSLTDNTEEFMASSISKFSYGPSIITNSPLHFLSVNLLFEDTVVSQEIRFSNWGSGKVFYKVDNPNFPFDPFAASFYILSRYEEYLPHSKDKHHRYDPEGSVCFRGGFLERPIINVWAYKIKELLTEVYPDLHFKNNGFTFSPSIDIDNAYAYKHKGFARASANLISHLIKFRFQRFLKRVKVHLSLLEDPYDSYTKQVEIHRKYNLKPSYFILLGDYGRFDKNIAPSNKTFQKLIKDLDNEGEVGLHPSYRSNKDKKILFKEKERLEQILGRKVSKSRQHFIKLSLPGTYKKLMEAGIEEDFSMGYPNRSGFRAGTCTSFSFYDLENNSVTGLRVHPFAFMDTTLKTHQKVRSKDVTSKVLPIINEVKQV
ncbi:MAG: polysaccharide deacetylase family protein [Cytophagaceae bacterium]